MPFFVEWPDENLVAWFGEGLLSPGRVLELGCGHGRNATYLAGLGCGVDAVDLSAQAIEWAQKRAKSAGVSVEFQCCPIFDATFAAGSYLAAGLGRGGGLPGLHGPGSRLGAGCWWDSLRCCPP
jgi:SAM-dependent methyltransferase